MPLNYSNSRGPFLKLDANGNVFFTATSGVSFGFQDWLTSKCSGAGVVLWTNRYKGPTGGADFAAGFAVDRSGSAFVARQSGNGNNYDFVMIKYAAIAPVSSQPLNIQRLAKGVVLRWTIATFGLQSAPSVTGTFTNIPGATSPYTNSISGGHQFFRLAQ